MDLNDVYKIKDETEQLQRIYEYFNEDTRLNRSKAARVEFLTTVRYIERYIKPGDKLLDIGAGAGEYSLYFSRRGYSVSAVELADRNIEAFRRKIQPDDNIELVIGPAMGAVQMAYEVSRHIGCENFFTERDDSGKMCLRRGFEIQPGQRVLVVEDVVTTGGSVKEVMELVRQADGIVAGVGSVVDRTGGKIDFGVPFKAVYSADVTSWTAEECPLCKAGDTNPVKPGSRKK